MNTVTFNMLIAVAMALTTGSLGLIALARHYPIRSQMQYVVLHLLALSGVVGAFGPWVRTTSLEQHVQWVLDGGLSGANAVLRGAAVVFILALFVYELSRKPKTS